MMKSLYSGVAGMKTHNQRMDVIGNNISNVNTTAFKASTVTFKDIFYQNKSRASSGDILSGGTNANQVGYGAALGTIAQLMVQSGLTYSDRVTDCAIQGEGFFQVMDQAGNVYYTRAGVFHIDNYGNLCDPNGNIVLGVSGDPTGVPASSQRINLYVPPIDNKEASVTKTLNLKEGTFTFTVSASAFGEEGNISLTIVDGEVPFATQNGSTIVVQIDLDQDFTEQSFVDAVNGALEAGGITLADGVLPLQWDFESLPPQIEATNAINRLLYGDPLDPTVDLTFEADTAGDFANSFEVDIAVNTLATAVSARWYDNVLTITIPPTGATTADIQAAIDAASAGNPNKAITVTGNDIAAADATEIGDITLRVGLANGKDNFFKTLAESIGTVKLTDGRRAAEQTTEDLEEIFIDDDGVIFGVHGVHGTIALGRIDLVIFENPEGLNQVGTSYWTESLSSGEAVVVQANELGVGSIVSSALEMSNTDLAQEISDMIITQRGFQANSRVITVSDTMLEELVNLKR